jgi:hypothetical protein
MPSPFRLYSEMYATAHVPLLHEGSSLLCGAVSGSGLAQQLHNTLCSTTCAHAKEIQSLHQHLNFLLPYPELLLY